MQGVSALQEPDVTEELFPPRLRFNVTQINTPYDHAQETHDLNRVERQLDFGGRDIDAVWSLINQHAEEIKAAKPTYKPLTQNSTSFIASLLDVVGLDFDRNLPGFNGNHPTNNPEPGDYPGLYNLLNFDYRLVGTGLNDIIRGAGGTDVLWGGNGDDTLTGNEGSDTLIGGPGIAAAGYFGPRQFYAIAWIGGATASSNFEGMDRLYNIEAVQFAERTEHITNRPLDYIASYSDLMAAFGASAAAGFDHFLTSGYNEGRSVSFNGLEYIASHGDLIKAFSANDDPGATHYLQAGSFEGRSTSFDGLEYISSNEDLIQAFGASSDAGGATSSCLGAARGVAAPSTAWNTLRLMVISSTPTTLRWRQARIPKTSEPTTISSQATRSTAVLTYAMQLSTWRTTPTCRRSSATIPIRPQPTTLRRATSKEGPITRWRERCPLVARRKDGNEGRRPGEGTWHISLAPRITMS